jgi:glycosidase
VWTGASNLPELNMEHPAVREHLYAGRDSAVRSLLREGVDGWRLDVAHDIGFNILEDLTRNAHEEKPGSLVVGELWNYPQEWFPCVDGVMNMAFRELIVRLAQGKIAARAAARMLARVVADAGVDNLLKSWLMLDNHDTVRLATAVPDPSLRRLAQLLQFTLPGAPNIYYGSELGMAGGADPEMRAPMRWDLVNDGNRDLAWHRQLVQLRRDHRALRIGDFRLIESDQLLAFERHTDRIEDSVFVIVNPGPDTVTECVMVANSKLMTNSPIDNLLAPEQTMAPAIAAMLELTLPPGGLLLLKPHTAPVDGYSTYKRVQ